MALRRKTSLKPRDEDENCTACSETRTPARTQRSKTSRPRSLSSSKSKPRALTSRLAAQSTTSPLATTSRLENSQEFLADLLKSDPTIERKADPVAQEKVASALDGLGKLESEVLNALFPADGSTPESVESIAARLGMTLEEVQGLADNALRGLRGTRGAGTRISAVWN